MQKTDDKVDNLASMVESRRRPRGQPPPPANPTPASAPSACNLGERCRTPTSTLTFYLFFFITLEPVVEWSNQSPLRHVALNPNPQPTRLRLKHPPKRGTPPRAPQGLTRCETAGGRAQGARPLHPERSHSESSEVRALKAKAAAAEARARSEAKELSYEQSVPMPAYHYAEQDHTTPLFAQVRNPVDDSPTCRTASCCFDGSWATRVLSLACRFCVMGFTQS